MEREVHRMEKQLSEKQKTIKQLVIKNNQLERDLSIANRDIQLLSQQANNNFSYDTVPDRQIIQTLEAKLASSSWQILQLQKMSMKYNQNITRLQKQRGSFEHEIRIKNHLLDQAGLNLETNLIQQTSIKYALDQWEETIKQKDQLVAQNMTLKEKIKSLEIQLHQKMSFYLNEVLNLGIKIKSINHNDKIKMGQFENNLKLLKKENEELRETLKKKNEQLMIFYQQSKMITTTKAADMHTIRNLKSELKKKGEQFFKVLSKLNQTEQLKKRLVQYNNSCSQTIGQYNKLTQSYENLKRQLGTYKQKLSNQEQKLKATQQIIDETNKKLLQLLVQNQACHELLFESRGCSNIFNKEVQQKINNYLNNLQKRRSYGETWSDVTELIQINQKMRVNQLQYCQSN